MTQLANMFSSQTDIERFFFEPGLMTGGAGGIGPVFAEKDPVMDFISLSLHPFEESFQANKFPFSVEKNLFLFGLKFFKRFLNRNSMPAASFPEIFVKILISGCVPGSKGFLFQGFFRVGDNLLPIDSNHSTKTLTGWAGPDRTVKGEEEGSRL